MAFDFKYLGPPHKKFPRKLGEGNLVERAETVFLVEYARHRPGQVVKVVLPKSTGKPGTAFIISYDFSPQCWSWKHWPALGSTATNEVPPKASIGRFKAAFGSLKGKQVFGDDAVEFQREMREEWQ